jgi:hypothetical protein
MENMEENSEVIWKIWKKSRFNCEKDIENTEKSRMNKIWKNMENRENCELILKMQKKIRLNCELIWEIWKKSKLNCEMIWKIWKKGKLNNDIIWKI